MAFLRLAFFSGGTAQHWRRFARLSLILVHPRLGGFPLQARAEGSWQVMQLWDTREDLERFDHDVFLAAIAKLDGTGFPQGPTVRDVVTVDAWIGQEKLS